MSTAALMGNLTSPIGNEVSLPFTAVPVRPAGNPDLTIHRRTKTHHGRTLLTLGHAAEYLVESRRYMMSSGKADTEAVHILMRLSREVFEDYVQDVAISKRVEDWVMDQALKIYG
ncbi:hypothetical protein [Edaphobacter bradus]|uniref:hypothetical protein n=1 Tax=Edaphobacter bradus TaxID=2259016 RepID=UPI0021DF8814|nr:hypothetical protein [Edaphobacter bradus]